MSILDKRCHELSVKYMPLAEEILREAVRIPADYYEEDLKRSDGYHTGMSNMEGPRLEYLKKMIIEHGAVENPEDVFIDKMGNLVWVVEDKSDPMPSNDKKVVMFDGHTDTVHPLRENWKSVLGEGIDCFDGMLDEDKVDEDALAKNISTRIPKELWGNYIWGRGSADQLQGVVSQIIATKIMLELKAEGALKGLIIRSVGTVEEEDNDGAGPMYIFREELPGAEKCMVPDVIVMTEGTGDLDKGALGIYRGQRGRMQIMVSVNGVSCHGSMPHRGLNPLEWGARILVEATEQVERGEGILDNAFLGKGSRTASTCEIATPSHCAVPEKFVFRFDRRMTAGETPEQCVADIEGLPAVAAARKAGLSVEVTVPRYPKESWTGYLPNNEETYLGWETPEDDLSVRAAVATYTDVITPNMTDEEIAGTNGHLKKEPRVGCWWFSTDGVGVPVPKASHGINIEGKNWIDTGAYVHPPMIGLNAGFEMQAHTIGENVNKIEIQKACSFMARFPSKFAEMGQ